MSPRAALPTCRFAPSPNGPLHLGHAWSALRNAAVARALHAQFLLRIENIDLARCTMDFEAAIAEDLHWLGLTWAEPVRRQSEHFTTYRAVLAGLAERRLVYPCFCTRGDIQKAVSTLGAWPRDPDGAPLYPGTCRSLSPADCEARIRSGQPHSLRLAMGEALASLPHPLHWEEFGEGTVPMRVPADPAVWGDAILRRKDIPTSYHLAVVVDDAAQDVTDVVRGLDLRAATHLHRLLQALLGFPAPRYHHHRLVLDEQGIKLSKSHQARPLAELRQAGLTSADIDRLIQDRLQPWPYGSSVVSQYR